MRKRVYVAMLLALGPVLTAHGIDKPATSNSSSVPMAAAIGTACAVLGAGLVCYGYHWYHRHYYWDFNDIIKELRYYIDHKIKDHKGAPLYWDGSFLLTTGKNATVPFIQDFPLLRANYNLGISLYYVDNTMNGVADGWHVVAWADERKPSDESKIAITAKGADPEYAETVQMDIEYRFDGSHPLTDIATKRLLKAHQ